MVSPGKHYHSGGEGAELLKIQFRWLVAESKSQHLKKVRDIEARAHRVG
jgi:hypothetical protein